MICSKCNVDKPESAFVFRKDRNKLQSFCKKCKVKTDKNWSLCNKEKRKVSKTKSDRKLRRTKPTTKIKDRLRSRLNTALTNSLKGKHISHIRHLGCSIQELVIYLENQFQPGMTWSNHGNKPNMWQVDHIKPFVSAKTEEELLQVVHYTNLRPIWWEDHVVKSATERH
jgi:hypothetical protein